MKRYTILLCKLIVSKGFSKYRAFRARAFSAILVHLGRNDKARQVLFAKPNRKKSLNNFIALIILSICTYSPNYADCMIMIRDSEIEGTLREILDPILDAAKVERKSVKIYVLGDKTINAFATFDRKIFVCTGLLLKAEKAEHIAGVLSHEVGHIACEHLIRHIGARGQSSMLSAALMLIGIGVGAATGSADLAVGGIMGGMSVGINTFLYHSRAEEEAADNKAIEYMCKLGLSPRGLLEITEILALSARLNIGTKNSLPGSHPDIEERVSYLRSKMVQFEQNHVDGPKKISPDIERKYKRIKVKLEAYSMPVEKVLAKYSKNDTSTEALYARAIALNRHGDFNGSIVCIDTLVNRFPQDPYLTEMKAQILYENSRLPEAIVLYRKLANLNKGDVLVNIAFANALIKSTDVRFLNEAEKVLYNVLAEDRTELLAWHLLSIVYGKKGDYGLSALMSAESSLLKGDKKNAITLAKRAIKHGLKTASQLQRAKQIAQIKAGTSKKK